jgi:hypothetical protein
MGGSTRNIRKGFAWVACLGAALGLLVADTAVAELQNVQVGGELRMRYRYYNNAFVSGANRRQTRIPNTMLPKRPVGPTGVSSIFSWDNKGHDWSFFETALILNVSADFTDDVSAFIELYDFAVWGEDFRSNYITGADARAVTADDIEVHQAYIQADNMFGTPLRLRVGRQELKFGKGFLVTNMLTPTQRLSFDALRLSYITDDVVVDAFASKLFEAGVAEQDGDVDFYGIHATYKALEPVDISAYWYWVRDARRLNDTNGIWFAEWLEDIFGLDDYDVTNLHTVGITAAGATAGFDYSLDAAYQFGDAHAHGFLYRGIGLTYGDDSAKYDNWAVDAVLGYTFDTTWSPRLFGQFVYFSGEDNRDLSFWDWVNPFYRSKASVSFNRLFTDVNYLPVINDNGWLSNFYAFIGGVEVQPTESVKIHLQLAKAYADKPFDRPVSWNIGGWQVPIAPAFSFWTEPGDKDLGWEAAGWVRYAYSEDLSFLLYYAHLFPGDGLTDGAFIQFNGTDFSGGSSKDDADYLFIMSVLKF